MGATAQTPGDHGADGAAGPDEAVRTTETVRPAETVRTETVRTEAVRTTETARAETARPAAPARPARRRGGLPLGRILGIALPLLLLALVALTTKAVSLNSTAAAGPKHFDAATYGQETFPKQQAEISKRAVPAAELAQALVADKAAAAKKYGVAGGTAPEFSTTFTGKVGAGTAGIYPVTVPGLPKDLLVRVQTGPAINGTDLRDATGTIQFGQFTNQIDYQNAAAALNTELKNQVLSKIDAANLTGKTIQVTGAFQAINPKAWLVTPVKVAVQ